ncbi:MAG TPA: hypothetical protein P5121_28550, partial [Caldilineaceae bacterium]|nr:hypothetical protein [Caldilineaceae bacterium]
MPALPALAVAELGPVAGTPPYAGAHPAATVHWQDLQDDWAVVTVITPTVGNAPAYRQTQFYHRTTNGWQRSTPDTAYWGAPRQLETSSFRWRYQERDAQVVSTAAPQLEVLYTAMRQNLGLVHAPPNKLTLEVSVTHPPGYYMPWLDVTKVYMVASPGLYQAPMDLTDDELLVQSLALPLLSTVIGQESEEHRLSLSWQPLLNGLRLWQLWDLQLPLSPWRQEIVVWFYGGLVSAERGQKVVLPIHYAELCAEHTLWLSSPLQIGIPFSCDELDQRAPYVVHIGGGTLLHLTYRGTP